MKPYFVITEIKEVRHDFNTPNIVQTEHGMPYSIPGRVIVIAELTLLGDGDFSEYLSDNQLQIEKINMDIIEGKIKIKA